ncbi:MAG: translesion error-prone DNA polymerase V autoproteolytic subunit [Alphaproteobacteria bacterium]|nr:translesion error-prone DNA polymerase V autoproteolytic subunit [Alphaproteobacteria bacterium]
MTHGGKRPNAGRKLGSGKYKEATKVMRIPISRIGDVLNILINENIRKTHNFPQDQEFQRAAINTSYALPLYTSAVAAGFPAPAEDHYDQTLDLNQHLLNNPDATFFVRATGNSMLGAGINSGDLLIVDRSIPPQSGKIVIAVVDGELTVKRLYKKEGQLFLSPENPEYPSIEITENTEFMMWGVVTNVIHAV